MSSQRSRQLRDRPDARTGRDGGRVPRPPAGARPRGGAQAPRSRARRPDARPALRPRGAAGRRARPPEHRHAVRLLRARRRAVHRDGVRQRRLAALAGRARSTCRRCSACSRACSPGSPTRSGTGSRTATSSPRTCCVTRRGNVKIADFGIARAYNALSQRLTATGMAMGTPVYMAPEQATGRRARAADRPLRARRDRLRAARRAPAVRVRHARWASSTATSTSRRRRCRDSRAAAAVREWVEWLLEKAPADRPQSAGARRGRRWRRSPSRSWARTGGARRRSRSRPAATTRPRRRGRRRRRPTSRPRRDRPCRRCRSRRRRRSRRRGGGCSRRRWARVALLAVAAVGLAATLPRRRAEDAATRPPRGRARRPPPYDFDGDGRLELVASILAREPARLARAERRRAAAAAATAGTSSPRRTPGMPGRPGRRRRVRLRASPAATSTATAPPTSRSARPAATASSVLYGTGHGAGRRAPRRSSRGLAPLRLRPLAHDLDGDGYDDLLVAAPGDGRRSAASVHVLRGGPGGLSAPPRADDRAARRRRPVGFGTRLRLGDVDGDHHVDLVEGGPARPPQRGPRDVLPRVELRPAALPRVRRDRRAPRASRSATSTTTATRTSSRATREHDPAAGGAGVVRLWLGSRRGPRATPDPDHPGHARAIPGTDEPGDQFGAVVEAGDLDSDGYADMIVAAPGENDGAGRITVIRGQRDGYASAGNTSFDQSSPNVPGARRSPAAGSARRSRCSASPPTAGPTSRSRRAASTAPTRA